MSAVFLRCPQSDTDEGQWTGAVAKALSQMEGSKDRMICLEPRVYRIRASACASRFCAISNHDSAERRIAFDFSGRSDFIFDGQGAFLVFVGRVIPFFLEGCRNVILRNVTIDWERPFFTEGLVQEVRGREEIVIKIDTDLYPLGTDQGEIVFTGEDYESQVFDNAVEADNQRGEVASGARDCWGIRERHSLKPAGEGLCVLQAPFVHDVVEGNRLILPHELRTSPAVVLSRSRAIAIEDFRLYQAGGMGLIAQKCSDVVVRRLQVVPNPARGCFTSLNADATHFVECSGAIELADCVFRGQMDDGVNVHGVYGKIVATAGNHELKIEFGHSQQAWVDYFDAGDSVAIVDPDNFQTEIVLTVESVRRLDGLHQIVSVTEPVPVGMVGKVLGSTGRGLSFLAERNRFERNRADGMLLCADGNLIIQENEFSVLGHGILVTCDASEWFESGPVGSVTIERNTFRDCSYGMRPDPSAIHCAPNDTGASDRSSIVHRGVTIRRNTFIGRRPFVSLYRTEAEVEGNVFLTSDDTHDPTGALVYARHGQTG